MSSCELSKYIETKLQITCFYLVWSFLEKKGLELVSLPHFVLNFFKKNISLVIFYLLTKIHFLVAFDDDDDDDDDDD